MKKVIQNTGMAFMVVGALSFGNSAWGQVTNPSVNTSNYDQHKIQQGFMGTVIQHHAAPDVQALSPTGNNPVQRQSQRTYTTCGYLQESSNFQTGEWSNTLIGFRAADDFVVPAGECLSIERISANFFTQNPAYALAMDIRFYADAGGLPGAEVASYVADPSDWSTILVGGNFGFPAYEYTIRIPTPIDLCGGASGTTYWFSIQAVASTFEGGLAWESVVVGSPYGNNGVVSIGGGPWEFWLGMNFVFELNPPATGTDILTACDSLTWIDGNTYTSSNDTATHTLVGVTAAGCDSIVTLNLTINNSPTAAANGCNLVYAGAGIAYACAKINGSATGGTPGYSYSWSNGETTPSITVCPNSTTTYTLTVTDANGCSASADHTVMVADISCGNGNSAADSLSSASVCSSSSSDSLSGDSSLCSLSSSSLSGGDASGVSCNNGSSKGPDKVLMCFDGITYCVNVKALKSKLDCGYTLGPCDMQQPAACNNTPEPDTTASNCVCSDRLTHITVRYLGESGQDVNIFAKKCSVPLGSITNASTGDTFVVDASDAGLNYLRNHTYFHLTGTNYGSIKIPTNCCNNPIGRVFFPFEIIGWTDVDGNVCSSDPDRRAEVHSTPGVSLIEKSGVQLMQYPNPVENNATFEFSTTERTNASLSVMSISGEIVSVLFNGNMEASKTYTTTLDMTDLQSGIYFARLITSNGIVKKKFVVLK